MPLINHMYGRYQFFSDVSFGDLFWSDSESDESIQITDDKTTPQSSSTCTPPRTNTSSTNTADEKVLQELHINTLPNHPIPDELLLTPKHDKSSPTSLLQSSPPNKKHLTYMDDVIQHHFPTLENSVVDNVKFPGLNALEFFEVYFADGAPYSFKEFQSTMGDIDIEYSKWKRRPGGSHDCDCGTVHSFHPNACHQYQSPSPTFPNSSRKERVLNFKTLTKSYFGPAYATARKTQRVSKFSTRLVIIESKTELFDIPFSDRFFVVERWVIEADKDSSSSLRKGCIYTAKLSVSVQVFMLKSCNWEKQIQSKTLSTLEELLESWTTKATQALGLAIKKKLERRKLKQRDDTSLTSYRSELVGDTNAHHEAYCSSYQRSPLMPW